MSDGNGPTRAQLGWVVLMVLGEVLMALSAGALVTVRAWAQFALGAALVAAGGMQLRAPVLTKLRHWLRGRSRKTWTRLAGWTAAVAATAVAVWFAAPPAVAYGQFLIYGCEHPTELRVVTAPEDLELYRGVAHQFERSTAEVSGCPRTHVSVYAVDPARAVDGLAAGWGAEYLRDYGPRPDVLVTTSPGEVDRLRELVEAAEFEHPVAVRARVVGWTPLVLGVPVGVVGRLGETDRKAATWHELLGAAQAAGIGVARPYPTGSGVGLLATDALLSGPDGALRAAGAARETTRWADRSTDAAGYPLATGVHLLSAHRAAPEPTTAVIVPEQALVQSNRRARVDGRGLLPDCGSDAAPPACLTAYYPRDTFRVRHTVAPLRWAVAARAHDAALAFGDWLDGPDGRDALDRTGLRTDGPEVGDLLSDRYGALAGPQVAALRAEPDRARQDAVRALHEQSQRQGRVLLALDASGSMATLDGPGQTRMETAVRGVRGAVDLLGAEDVVGLWTFSGAGVRSIVPFGQRDTAAATARDRLSGLRPQGVTPLYRAIADGVAAVGPSDDRRVSALVVLTDGLDTVGDISASAMVDSVRDKGVRVFVVALGEADCAASALAAVTAETGGACLDAGPGSVDRTLTDLFRRLWG